ncbi:MAG: hypothetical protein V1932_05605 [Chloroflexota bacterium]
MSLLVAFVGTILSWLCCHSGETCPVPDTGARIQVYLYPPLDSSLRWNDIFEKVI